METDIAIEMNTERDTKANEITSKINATRNVIRKKFEKAYKNRLEHEYDADEAMKPLSAHSSFQTGDLEPKEIDCSALKKHTKQLKQHHRLAAKIYSNDGEYI